MRGNLAPYRPGAPGRCREGRGVAKARTRPLTGELVAHWRARLAADPVLNMTFARAYATYVAWLKANPRP
jgi:hypothetical protein